MPRDAEGWRVKVIGVYGACIAMWSVVPACAKPQASAPDVSAPSSIASPAAGGTVDTASGAPMGAPSGAPAPAASSAAARAPILSTAPPSCAPHERSFGSACCSSPAAAQGRHLRVPGQAILTCHGPRIGLPCTNKGDCDIGCNCPSSETESPHARARDDLKDGTTGLVGTCARSNYVGTWMCRLDEAGKVTHMIID